MTVVISTYKINEYAKSTMLSELDELPSIQIGDLVLRLEVDDLTPKVQEIARKELRETPEIKEEAMTALREMLREDKELKSPYENDPWLLRFLRPCKFYPESSYALIKRYYAFKTKHANIYDGLMPSNTTSVFEHNVLMVLPNRDQFGRRMLILELGKKWKHNQLSLDEVFKGAVLHLEAALLEPETQVCGAVVIFDMDGLSMAQTMQFTPPFAKRIVDWLQDCVPCRIKNLHVVNQPYIFNIVFALFKPFLKDKLKKRIVFHGTDRKSLHKYISPKCLNDTYGGTLEVPRISGNEWLKLLKMCDKEYEEINSYGYKKN